MWAEVIALTSEHESFPRSDTVIIHFFEVTIDAAEFANNGLEADLVATVRVRCVRKFRTPDRFGKGVERPSFFPRISV